MASAKQIAANRANAQRSTGPKTALGKRKSSRNSFRHGLSWPLPLELATASKVDAIARALTPRDAGEAEWTSAMEFATAQIELLRIRTIRTELLLRAVDIGRLDTRELQRLASLDRYERYADTQRRRASLKFGDGNPNEVDMARREPEENTTVLAKTNPI
jgi:hypothetical protein